MASLCKAGNDIPGSLKTNYYNVDFIILNIAVIELSRVEDVKPFRDVIVDLQNDHRTWIINHINKTIFRNRTPEVFAGLVSK